MEFCSKNSKKYICGGSTSPRFHPPSSTDCKSAILTLSAAALFDIPVAMIAPELIDQALGEKLLSAAKRNFDNSVATGSSNSQSPSKHTSHFFSRLQASFSFNHLSHKVRLRCFKNNFQCWKVQFVVQVLAP